MPCFLYVKYLLRGGILREVESVKKASWEWRRARARVRCVGGGEQRPREGLSGCVSVRHRRHEDPTRSCWGGCSASPVGIRGVSVFECVNEQTCLGGTPAPEGLTRVRKKRTSEPSSAEPNHTHLVTQRSSQLTWRRVFLRTVLCAYVIRSCTPFPSRFLKYVMTITPVNVLLLPRALGPCSTLFYGAMIG